LKPGYFLLQKFRSYGIFSNLLRKDAQIGEIYRQNAKRATSADSPTELRQGVTPVALTDLRRLFSQNWNFSWVARVPSTVSRLHCCCCSFPRLTH